MKWFGRILLTISTFLLLVAVHEREATVVCPPLIIASAILIGAGIIADAIKCKQDKPNGS